MSCVLLEGFHLYTNLAQMFDGVHGSRWTDQGTGTLNAIELTGGEESQPALAVTWDGTNGQDYVEMAFPIANPIIFGGRWKWDSLPSSSMEFLHFRDQANIQCHFQCQNDGRLDLYLSTFTFRADSDPINPIIAGQWQDFEFKMNITDATGTASVYVDGVQVMNAGPFDIKFTDLEGASEIRLVTEFSATGTIRWSDLYMLAVDGTPPNDHLKAGTEPMRVKALRPDADVTVDFVPDSGPNNFSRVDEAGGHDFDSSFNRSAAVGARDIFDVPSPASPIGSVKTVQLSYAARTDDGGPKNVKGFQRQGAVQDSGASNAIAVAYNIESDVFDDDANGAAWTKALLSSATFGYEIV